MFRKTGLLLIEIDSKDLELYRSPALHIEQQIEHRIAVLSTRKTDHDLVAVFDHSKVADRPAHFLEQLSFGLGLHEQLSDLPPKRQIFACEPGFNKS